MYSLLTDQAECNTSPNFYRERFVMQGNSFSVYKKDKILKLPTPVRLLVGAGLITLILVSAPEAIDMGKMPTTQRFKRRFGQAV
jgi:hypothetical protein